MPRLPFLAGRGAHLAISDLHQTGLVENRPVGDHVRFNHQVRPRDLEYEHGVITEIDDRWVAVRLWRPVGRFRSGELRSRRSRWRSWTRRAHRLPASNQD